MTNFENYWVKGVKKGCLQDEMSSWEDFVDYVKDEKRCWPTLLFRGQANHQWKLYSRLDRLETKYNTKPNNATSHPKEFGCPPVERDTHLNRFKELALDKIKKNDISDDILWAIAQHHGLATPLLDFTYSPFVALFFAFEEEKCWCDAGGENLFQEPDKRVVFAVTDSSMGKHDEDSKAIKELIVPFSTPGSGNYRAVSQAGVFLNMPYDPSNHPEKWDLESFIENEYGDETYHDEEKRHPQLYLQKFTIPNNKKDRIDCLRFLDQMNINRSTLFPDLDGIAKYVNDLWEINFDKALGHLEQV